MYQGFDGDMGNHILLNLKGCRNNRSLCDLAKFQEFIPGLLHSNKAVVVSSVSHQFEGGFTYLSLLTTSHFSAHTWPEFQSVAVDLFTCSKDVNTEEIVKNLVMYFGSERWLMVPVLR
jgi:S-adenosylmethionine decarboxylase